MELEIKTIRKVFIDESKLPEYAREVRERFELEENSPVNMADILYQAGLDGDVDLPEAWDLESFEEDLSPEDIENLQTETEEGPEHPEEGLPAPTPDDWFPEFIAEEREKPPCRECGMRSGHLWECGLG